MAQTTAPIRFGVVEQEVQDRRSRSGLQDGRQLVRRHLDNPGLLVDLDERPEAQRRHNELKQISALQVFSVVSSLQPGGPGAGPMTGSQRPKRLRSRRT